MVGGGEGGGRGRGEGVIFSDLNEGFEDFVSVFEEDSRHVVAKGVGAEEVGRDSVVVGVERGRE